MAGRERKHMTDNARKGAWRDSNPNYTRTHHLKKAYGLTMEQYESMLVAQHGVCATCHKPETTLSHWNGNAKRLHVDHDHVTGKVRGLLCGRCNAALGHAGDSITTLLALVQYLQRHSGKLL